MSDFIKTYPLQEILFHGNKNFSMYFARPFDVKPGQFVLLWLPGVNEKPFSVSGLTRATPSKGAPSGAGSIEISVKAIGPFTEKLSECRPGDYVGIRGPFGNHFSTRENTLLIGGGIGIAPMRFQAARLKARRLAPTLLFGVRTAQDMIFPKLYRPSAKCFLTSEDGSVGKKGLVIDLMDEIASSRRIDLIQASGPERMLLATRSWAMKHKIPVELSFERYMKCGIGICGQCCMDGSGIRLCVEGPILTETALQDITELGLPHRGPSGRRHESPQ